MLDCGLLRPSQTKSARNKDWLRGFSGKMELASLFIGFHPDDVFFRLVSVEMAELFLVFGTIVVSLGALVWFGNWWSR